MATRFVSRIALIASLVGPESAPLDAAVETAHHGLKTFNVLYMPSANANHLTQHLCTVWKLGGTKARLEEIVKLHSPRFDPRPAPTPGITVDEGNWASYLGQRKHFINFVDYFLARFQTASKLSDKKAAIQSVLATHLPRLSTGIAAAAFHAFILLGFGCEFEDLEVVAEGLGYLCFAWADLGTVSKLGQEKLSVGDILRGLKSDIGKDPKRMETRKGFMGKFVSLKSKDGPTIARWASHPPSLRDLDLAAALLFSQTRDNKGTLDFFLCHGLTSLHALHCILPYLDGPLREQVTTDYFHGFLYLYLAQGRLHVPVLKSLNGLDDHPEVVGKTRKVAIETDDEHVSKVLATRHAPAGRLPGRRGGERRVYAGAGEDAGVG
jgi:hypothetical protein